MSASLSTAPYAAGPGLPREPPSASMMTEAAGPRRSQTRLGRAHQDPLALLAADHLVGGRGRITASSEGSMVAGSRRTGGRGARPRRRRPSGRGAGRRGRAGRRAAPRRPGRGRRRPAPSACVELGEPVVARGASASASRSSTAASWRSASRARAGRPRAGSITSSSSSSSEVIRRCSDSSSPCIRSRSLGLLISPWSIRSWSRLRRALTCSTSASTLVCSAVEVVDHDLGVAAPGRRARRASVCSAAISASSGSVARWWRSRSARESSSWRSSSASWAAGSAFSALLERCVSARKVQGSVHVVLTRVPTVSPSASATFPATTGSQVHSAAQCATSTSAGPPFSRNSLAGWCRRSLVT